MAEQADIISTEDLTVESKSEAVKAGGSSP